LTLVTQAAPGHCAYCQGIVHQGCSKGLWLRCASVLQGYSPAVSDLPEDRTLVRQFSHRRPRCWPCGDHPADPDSFCRSSSFRLWHGSRLKVGVVDWARSRRLVFFNSSFFGACALMISQLALCQTPGCRCSSMSTNPTLECRFAALSALPNLSGFNNLSTMFVGRVFFRS
jgi:hypothetical protein